jgi:hypothetical protein
LLSQSKMMGGGSLKDLVLKIKVHNQGLMPQPQNSVQCFACKLFLHKKSLLKHQLDHHGLKPIETKKQKAKIAYTNAVADMQQKVDATATKYMHPMIEDFNVFLGGMDGGLKADPTTRASASAINNICLKAGLKATIISDEIIPLDIIAEENRQQLNVFLKSEMVRVRCGFRNTVTALGHFHRFITARKMSEIKMANLKSSMTSFASSVDGWKDSSKITKKKTSTDQREKLDKNYKDMVENGRVDKLFKCIAQLKITAEERVEDDPTCYEVAIYLQSQICFGHGKSTVSFLREIY